MNLAIGTADLMAAFKRHELWRILALNDLKKGNAQSRLGILWHTLSFIITAGILGFLYSTVFGQNAETYVPYLAGGFLAWRFISAIATEGSMAVASGAGLLTQMRIPISLFPLRMVCHHAYMFGLNAIGFVVILAAFRILVVPQPLLLALGLLVVLWAGVATALLLGVAAIFQRWMRNLIPPLMSLAFFVTPILWKPNMVTGGDASSFGLDLSGGMTARAAMVLVNPFFYFLEIVRGPLLGYEVPGFYWLVAILISLVLSIAALGLLSVTKSRVLLNL